MMNKLFIIAIACLLLTVMCPFQTLASPSWPLVTMGPAFGIRPMGMGGAVVADISDFTAVYWNPAGLAHNVSLGLAGLIHGDLRDAYQESSHYIRLLYGEPSFSEYQEHFNLLKAGYAGDFHVGLFASVYFRFAGLSYIQHDWVTIQGCQYDETMNITRQLSDTFVLSGACKWAMADDRWLSVGLNAKASSIVKSTSDISFLGSSVGEERITGSVVSLDIGVMYQPTEQFRFGIMGRNVFSYGQGVCAYTLKNMETQEVLYQSETPVLLSDRPAFDVGISYTPSWLKGLSVNADIHGIRASFLKDSLVATVDSIQFGIEQTIACFSFWYGIGYYRKELDWYRLRHSCGIGYSQNGLMTGVSGVSDEYLGWALQGSIGYKW